MKVKYGNATNLNKGKKILKETTYVSENKIHLTTNLPALRYFEQAAFWYHFFLLSFSKSKIELNIAIADPKQTENKFLFWI